MESGKWKLLIGNWKGESRMCKVERVTWILEIGKWNWESGKWNDEHGAWKVERRSGIGSRRGSGLEVKLEVESGMLKVEC